MAVNTRRLTKERKQPVGGQYEGRSNLERHIGTLLQVLIAGALFWIGSTAVELKTQVTQLQTKVDYLGQRSVSLDDFVIKLRDNDWNRKDQDVFERGLRERMNAMDVRITTNQASVEEIRRRLDKIAR